MTAVGRNAPCPCGSDRKYKHCCGTIGKLSGWTDEMRAAVEAAAAAGRELGDNELQRLADMVLANRNARPLDDFAGLSPSEMDRLLHAPLTSPDLLRFEPPPAEAARRAPIVQYALGIAEAAGDRGLKATATGNLPRNLCRELIRAQLGDDGYAELTRFGDIQREPDFTPLHVARLMAEDVGLVKLRAGRFHVLRNGRGLLDDPGRLHLRLLDAYATSYNWAYGDRYPTAPFVQQAFAFGLYLLHRHGSEERPGRFYGEAFVRAFPSAADAIESTYCAAEELLAQTFEYRLLHSLCMQFALVEISERPSPDGARFRDAEIWYRRSALCEQVLRFRTA